MMNKQGRQTNWIDLKGPYKCLDNSYVSPIIVEGISYPSVEHAFKAAQTSDRNLKFKISKASNLLDVQKLLKDASIRPNWDDVKYATLHQLVKLKFESHKDLANILIGTGSKQLGGRAAHMKRQFRVGQILMKVRGEIAGRG
jgi:predicted NAD-dependent protein-ADP-ribosyltransferase YbiA (DUF1768 family)